MRRFFDLGSAKVFECIGTLCFSDRDGYHLFLFVWLSGSQLSPNSKRIGMDRIRLHFLVALCLVSLAAFVGCGPKGPKLHPVTGMVEVNGKPTEHALVFMHRKERNPLLDPLPYGTSAGDGRFEIETPDLGKGAQEGSYTLTVYLPDMTKPEDSNGQRPDALNGAYEKVAESSLVVTVSAGKNELPSLKLVPGPPRARQASDKNNK
ncbi:MAG: hypothetical protein ABL921_26365 [Pirellula sp.]